MWSWLTVTVVLGGLLGPSSTSTEKPQAPAFRDDWMAKDVARVRQLASVLDARELDVETLLRALTGADVRDDRKIGFGARRVVLAVYGGYTTMWIHVLATAPEPGSKAASRIASLRCDQLGPQEHTDSILAQLRDAWGTRASTIERGVRVERHDETTQVELRSKRDAALGRFEVPSHPERLRPSYERLVSPFETLALGRSHGDDGAPPPGRAEVQALIEARRLDLLSAALRGWNPEGRAWAAWGLLEEAKRGTALGAEDQRVIDALRALPLELQTSRGCVQERERFDAALLAIVE